MYFNHPEFLYGLLAVLIPVIIHLFNFRRYKKLWFSNIEFLKNITAQTRKQNKLKHLVVLLLRILAIIMIVIAFADPALKSSDSKSTQMTDGLTTVYIDNSFSMMAEGENGRLFEEAIANARELVTHSSRDKRFVLLTNNISPVQRRVLSKEAMLNEIEQLNISPVSRKINAIANTASSIAVEKEYKNHEMYLFSDFQKNSIELQSFGKDTAAFIYLLPFKHLQKRNIYIDTCWLSDPVLITNRKITINVRIRNSSDVDYEKIPLKLWINGQQKAVAGIDIRAGGYEVVTMNYSARQTGWHYGLLEIEDYPITFDDKFYFSFNVKQQVNVLEIGTEGQANDLELFYASDSLFYFERMDYQRVKYNELYDFNLIILNSLPSISNGLMEQMKEYVEAGGNLMFIPNRSEDKEEENQLLRLLGLGTIEKLDSNENRVVRIKNDHSLFREAVTDVPENADLPVVFKHYRYRYGVSSGVESLVSLLNGDDFLLATKIGNGRFYMLSVPLDKEFSNFISHPLFVPVMYGVAIEGDAYTELFNIIGKNEKIVLNSISNLPSNDQVYLVKKYREDYTFIPEQQIVTGGLIVDMHDGIESDGFYELSLDNDPEHVFAFNFNRNESYLDFYTADELNEQIESEALTHVKVLSIANAGYLELLNTVHKESQLWKLFIIFALLMLLSEILVLRFWK